MKFIEAKIPEVIVIEPHIYEDERGFFLETYQSQVFYKHGLTETFVQENHSGSKQNSLRGLHYQIKHTQAKIVRAISGKIFDAAVDIRRSSPTFGKWVGVHLSAENKRQLYIPKGFAHGFYVLSSWAEVIYKVDDFYAPKWERTILWNDPQISIKWPLINQKSPIISSKDQKGVLFHASEVFE